MEVVVMVLVTGCEEERVTAFTGVATGIAINNALINWESLSAKLVVIAAASQAQRLGV